MWQLLASCAAPGMMMIILCAARESGLQRVFWGLATAGPPPRRSRLAPGWWGALRMPTFLSLWTQPHAGNSAGRVSCPCVGLSQGLPSFSLALGSLWWPKDMPCSPYKRSGIPDTVRGCGEGQPNGSPSSCSPAVSPLRKGGRQREAGLLLLLEGQRLPPLPHSSSCLPSRLAGNASNSRLVESLQCCNHKSQRGGRRRVPSRGSQAGFTARRKPG